MRVTIVENTSVTHHGQIGVALHEAAARVQILRPWAGDVLPRKLEGDALVVFGGEQAATDDATHPYLPHLATLMAETSAAGTATLGICLGAQLFARGLGAENLLDHGLEFGWCEVTPCPEAATDPVLCAPGAPFPIFQWHADSFTLPQGTRHLATSPKARIQSFRHGRAGYAMQFHFEASRAVVADWSRTFPELTDRLCPGWSAVLPQEAASKGERADHHGLTLARNWVRLIET